MTKLGGGAWGIPIGNLSSQIFANIYLSEFDRFVNHELKPMAYVRYGDDCIMIDNSLEKLQQIRLSAVEFLNESLALEIHPKHDHFLTAKRGIRFLGVVLYSKGRKLKARNQKRIKNRLNLQNASSYFGLLKAHGSEKDRKVFPWRVMGKIGI